MFPSVAYEVKQTTLDVGDMAVLFTDGITEGRNTENQEFGEDGLTQLLKKNAKQPAAKIVEKVCHELASFTTGATPMDDMTFIVVKRTS
jgi:sigma-B regulation protein RsbU (phosphoserine phosphatase)